MTELTRAEWDELRQTTADELYYEVRSSVPEQEDSRLKYVTVQIDRTLWLRIKAIPDVAEVLRREANRFPYPVTNEEMGGANPYQSVPLPPTIQVADE